VLRDAACHADQGGGYHYMEVEHMDHVLGGPYDQLRADEDPDEADHQRGDPSCPLHSTAFSFWPLETKKR